MDILHTLGPGSWLWALLPVAVTGLLAVVQRYALGRLHLRLTKTAAQWDDALVQALRGPLSLLLWVVGLGLALELGWGRAGVRELIAPVRVVGVVSALTWFAIRLIDVLETVIIAQAQQTDTPYERATIDALAKLLRVVVLVAAGLVTLQTLGFSVSGVLAFGGLGGLVVGLAAKDLLANFFGGLMISLDRPFAVGDWIRSPDREIEGTVERIGWRMTLIRTLDRRPLYVPNAVFPTITVENPSRMQNRRIDETVGIRYEDADKMAAIVADVEHMLRDHPDIEQEQPLIVNFIAFAPSSLDFCVYTFTRATDRPTFQKVKQDVLLRIIGIIDRHRAEIAFPTSTLHLADGFVPAPRRAVAESLAEDQPGVPTPQDETYPQDRPDGGTFRSP